MKKLAKRVLSLTLMLLLLMSVPMTARADVVEDADVPTATMSWEENLQPCTATLRIPGETYYISVPITDASIVTISEGEQKVVTWPKGSYVEHAPTFTAEPSGEDEVRLLTLLGELGYDMDPMYRELPEEDADLEFYQTPAGLPAGKYSYGSEFKVIDAEWWILRGQLTGRAISLPMGADEGEIAEIPISCSKIKLIVIS